MPKTLVCYVFHIYNKRVQYFIDHALFKADDVDFVMIINDEQLQVTVPDYVTILRRKNEGYDFGAWSEAVLTNDRSTLYDFYIFINSSVLGPFMPPGSTQRWTDRMIAELSESIRLVGPTINTCRDPTKKSHVQSYAFAMNQETLQYLIQKEIFTLTNQATKFIDAINNFEIRMSQELIQHGWNISSFMTQYKGVDFTFRMRSPESYGRIWLDDIMYPHILGRICREKEDILFIKGNRFGIQ